MAPLASEPRQVLTVLITARRKALYTLLVDITRWMRSQIELKGNAGDGERSGASSTLLSPELVRLRSAALAHFDNWRRDTLSKLKELLSTPDSEQIVEERRQRTEKITQLRAVSPTAGESPVDGDKAKKQRASDVARLQQSYHATSTRLSTISCEDREEILSCVLLLLLSSGRYPPESRTLAVYLASALELPLSVLNTEEIEVATLLLEKSAEAAQQGDGSQLSADAEAQKRKQENQKIRYLKVGIASVAGAALIGITGGLAAPAVAGTIGGIMGAVGLGSVASFLGIFFMNPALVGSLFGAFGARMTGEMVDQYAKEVEDFRFIPLQKRRQPEAQTQNQQNRRLRVTIGINGWLDSRDDITKPWRFMGDDSEVFALRYEMNSLMGLGSSLENLVTSSSWNFVKMEILKRTVLATLWSALWPAYLLSMATSVDNPFSLAKNRSEKAGKILADALINRVQGERPVTLVGFSLGARVIYSCLRSLVERRAFGLVDSVVLIGAPVPSNRTHWMMMRSVVSGKMYNVHSENDYLLAFIYRATSVQLGVAGLQAIEDVAGVENLNLSDQVHGHLRYPKLIDKILALCGFTMAEGAAAGPIEEEDDELLLHNADHNVGNLIELDELSITGPARPTEADRADPPTELERQPPQASGQRETQQAAADTGGSHHKSLSVESPNMKYLGTMRDMALNPRPQTHEPPAYSPDQQTASGTYSVSPLWREEVLEQIPVGAGDRADEDSDVDSGFGIRMVDNESDHGDLSYMEPIPMD